MRVLRCYIYIFIYCYHHVHCKDLLCFRNVASRHMNSGCVHSVSFNEFPLVAFLLPLLLMDRSKSWDKVSI